MEEKPPGTMIIPYPRPIAYGRGIESTVGPNGCLLQCRGTEQEKDKIKDAAAFLGVSYGAFMRSVVNSSADVILAIKAKHDAETAGQQAAQEEQDNNEQVQED